MSENNNTELVTIEPEVMPGLSFDFEFIAQTLNLIQIQGGTAAINLTSISDIEQDENKDWVITLESDQQYTLNDGEMAELEKNLRQRIEDNKVRAKETMIENFRMQVEAQTEAQGRVQGGKIVGVGGRRVH